MRALLATSIGVAAAGALLLPLAPAGSADPALSDTAVSRTDAAHPAPRAQAASAERGTRVPGHTQSLPLGSPANDTRTGQHLLSAWEDDPSGGRRLASRDVNPFSLVGVVWDDPDARLHGRLQVQTRAADTGRWSAWRSLEAHAADRPDRPGRSDAAGAADKDARGATAPLWVGASDAVRVRVVPTGDHSRPRLPEGVRLELVDPGPDSPQDARTKDPSAHEHSWREGKEQESKEQEGKKNDWENGWKESREKKERPATRPQDRPGGVLPALNRAETEATYGEKAAEPADPADKRRVEGAHIGPRPAIVTRKGWGANEGLRRGQYLYTGHVKAAFVHHTADTNDYSCDQSASIVRGIYRYHVKSSHWRDIGYNFLVDKCGQIFEGRAGGIAKPVMGAHTLGFNADTTGIAVLGSYDKKKPSKAAMDALAKLTAWKLGLNGVDADGKVTLTSGGSNKYAKGTPVRLHTISGHRDGFVTDCPGDALYDKLGDIRAQAAHYQGR